MKNERPFDIHAPFDAPIRERERREREEHERPISEASKRAIRKMAREAWKRLQSNSAERP